jgi:hypothetical protein
MGVFRFIGPSFCLVLAAGCAAPEGESVGDSGLLNALAQIRAVNLPLELGDPVLQPELGHTLELQHDMTDTMAPRAFAELADGSFRLNAHDFVAHIHPDRVVLNTAEDPEGVTVRLSKWGRGGDLALVSESLLEGERDSTFGGVDLVEADRGNLVEWFDGATRGMEHGWTIVHRPSGSDLLGFELTVDAAVVDVSIDAKRAWFESDEGTVWNVSGLAAWDADGRPLELWLEPGDAGLMVRVDDTDAIYPITVDPWYTTTSTEIQNTTSSSVYSNSGSIRDEGTGCRCGHASTYTGTIAWNGNESDLTSEWGGNNYDYRYGTIVRGISDTNGDGADELIVASHTWLLDCSETSDETIWNGEAGELGGTVSVTAPGCDNEGGRAFIYNGREGGLNDDHVATMRGDGSTDHFGRSIITSGDFNGDDHNDLLVGIPLDDDGGTDAGSLRLFPGTSIGIADSAVTTIHGEGDDENLGLYTYRFGAGDIDGDGKDDLVVGIPTDDETGTDAGKIIVYMGTGAFLPTYISETLYGEVAGDRFGESVAVSDVNGDGYADVVVGAPNNDDGSADAGKVYVFEGTADGMSTTASHGQYGESSSNNLGQRLYSLGDINGDGYGDVYMAGDSSDARVYHGDASGLTGVADQRWSRTDLEAIGDINEDGYDDIRIGEEIKMGSESGEMRLWATTTYLQSVGDFDGDGYTDLAMGDGSWSSDRGRIWIRYGYEADYDVDGFLESEDCDDADATVYPGAEEIVGDGVDNDCDGTETCYADADGDGHASDDGATVFSEDSDCDDEGEATADAPRDDCDDSTALARPGGTEIPGDGVDQDCNGADLCYADLDGDGYRSSSGGTVESVDMDCDDEGEATSDDPATDCNDTNPSISPAAVETPANGQDEDCNGGELCYVDSDDDGYRETTGLTIASSDMDCTDSGEGGASEPPTDCDDDDATIHPAARDIVLDGIDQNCDGGDDCYADADGDGYAASDGTTVVSADFDCTDAGEAGVTVPATDCDDSDPLINPGAAETAGDELDLNCDGSEICLSDADLDGYAATGGITVISDDTDCTDEGEARIGDATGDCDDENPDVYPGAEDIIADGIDGDCDGREVCYTDGDGDGVPAVGSVTMLSSDADCEDEGEAIASDIYDCNDADASVYPGAPEIVVDGIDQDCDGGDACFADADDDGFRDASGATVLSEDADCGDPGEAVAEDPATDCDDSDATINPDAYEYVADGRDSDCDGYELCYTDVDGDGFRPVTGATTYSSDMLCDGDGEALPAMLPTDCDDFEASVRPDAAEVVGDGVDSNCDGTELCYVDADGDGFAAGDLTIESADPFCTSVGEAGVEMPRTDCDDADASINPDATEVIADGVDSDCDGFEQCLADRDDDGYTDSSGATVGSDDDDCDDAGEGLESDPATDCDDLAASAYPGASEITADGTDQDCDGTETCYVDADGDGHAEPTGLTTTSVALDCSDDGAAPIGAAADDCNDADVSVYPGATEAIADGVDQNCDGGEMCYVDADADGARSPDGSTVASSDMECDEEGEASGLASVDCDDGDASVHPSAEESPADGIDADCDGAELCYTDYDGDGYRPDEYSEVEGDLLCTGAGLVGADAPGGDCDDGDASINPDGEETVADGVDGNCDGIEQCYVDADNDGYRTTDGAIVDSEAIDCDGDGVAGSDAPDTDCNDDNADVNPGMGDAIGDELDADCDGFEMCYADLDGDGYRTAEVVESEDADCEDVGEANRDAPLVDCDDSLASRNPGAEEIPGDGVDQDCDGVDPAGDDDDSVASEDGTDDPSGAEGELAVSVEYPPEKGGCSTAPRGSGGLAWLLSLGLIVGLRREN